MIFILHMHILLKELLSPNQNLLYHATYSPLLNKIKKFGLDNTKGRTMWNDSVSGVVYLAKDKDVAISYAETAEDVPESYFDNIIVLTIDVSKLDKSKLFIDRNVQDNEGDTLEYHGVIPFSSVIKIEKI